MKNVFNNNIFEIAVLCSILLCELTVNAQQSIVMPHQAADTIYLNSTDCYTILDPGGIGKYMHNEDSYLYIISNEPFIIDIEYETGYVDDGKDWIRIYYDTVDWNGDEYMCGTGHRTIDNWSGLAKIYFHSNNFNSYDGFTIRLLHRSSISPGIPVMVGTNSVNLNWNDGNSSATSWTVYYACSDNPDSLHSITTSSQTLTLTDLVRNTYYRYWILNNITSCVYVGDFKSYDEFWFQSPTNPDTLLLPPNFDSQINPEPGYCYHLFAATGPGNNSIEQRDWMGTQYNFNDGHGVYIKGEISNNSGDFYTEFYTPWDGFWGNWMGNAYNIRQWLPDGKLRLFLYRRTKFDFEIAEENSRWLTPTVTSVTATSATISWTDSSSSTLWTVRYTSDDFTWQQQSTTTKNITLTGLQPGRQYVYTIEGSVNLSPCAVAARHGFVTDGLVDTILMPYRGNASVTIQPGACYTLMDAGGNNIYFRDDFSRLVVRTANQRGFRIVGHCHLSDPDRLCIFDGLEWRDCAGDNYDIDISTHGDSAVFAFQSNSNENRDGFVLSLLQLDTTIRSIQSTSVTASGATISWIDNSGATSWTLHYGNSEDNMQTLTTTTQQVILSGLAAGTQYVYWVTSGTDLTSCVFSERRGFITQGVPQNVVIMPYRKIDTIYYSVGNCITILDPGGTQHDYFNRDTSELVIISSDNSSFVVEGIFLFDGNEADYAMLGYDGNDRIGLSLDPNSTWYDQYDGWWNNYNNPEKIYRECEGYVRLRFVSNGTFTTPGFRFMIHPIPNSSVSNITMTHVYSTSAVVNWNDDNSASWRVSWSPVLADGTEGVASSLTVATRSCNLTGLSPQQVYMVRVVPSSLPTNCSNGSFATFTTMPTNSIIMPHNGTDTVYISPGQCWYIYDDGGTGDYFSSDTSTLVVLTTTGEGFFYNFSANVGNVDYSDNLFISDVHGPGSIWWGWDGWHDSGNMTIQITSNEALQASGLWMLIRFPSRAYNPDTLNMTDSTVTIMWQDTSGTTQWQFSYGPNLDSMTTAITTTKHYTMTGLSRNRQYYYSIYTTSEAAGCTLENYYGVIMPCDPGVIILPYGNYYGNRSGRHTVYRNGNIAVPPSGCMSIYDDGSFCNIFHNCSDGVHIYSPQGFGITLEGYYDIGNSSLYTGTSKTGNSYGASGYINVYCPDGWIDLSEDVGSFSLDLGHGYRGRAYPAPGFRLNVHLNYPLFNIRTQNVTCTSATLTWDDTSSASQWTVAYGPAERQLDTVAVSTKSLHLTGLIPDQQYVCYISNNMAGSCFRPVKYCFVTTCDTTIFVVPYNRDTTRVLDINSCYTILDPGAGNDYFYDDRSQIILQSSSPNSALTLRGWVHCGPNDGLNIWNDVTGEWVGGFSNNDYINIFFKEGRVHLEWVSGGDTNIEHGFELHASFHSIYNIHTTLKSDTTSRIEWNDVSNATQWICFYGQDKHSMDSVVCNESVAHLSGLKYGHRYYVFFKNNSVACLDTTWFDFCAGGDKCIEFGDIYSCFATCYHGRFNNPEEYKEMINFGPDDINSRHTVVDDTLATDPRTGNMLRCVPPGNYESIRLGNWDIGGEAESIIYEYDVDTTKSEILLLRYAAVLENPGHSPSMQPRFRFSLVDNNMNEIDHYCYTADFVSSSTLGWNTYQYDTNIVLWKDWTAVGVDLTPLHGQRIYMRLTTYDCNEMGHYGYAYFTLECQDKEIHPNDCGVVHDNTFTAPEGFRYRWYNIDSADVTISTQRTFTSSQNGTYKCRASFLGNEDGNCYFEKTAVVGDIFPFAQYEYQIIDTIDCDVIVQFYNRSCVTLDSAHQQRTSMECDGYVWDFGDGTLSSEKHPSHRFPAGHFDVTLSALLADGTCSDDETKTILMRSPCISFDTVYSQICQGDTFALRDSLFITYRQPHQFATQLYNYVIRTEYSWDSILETFVNLAVHPSLDSSLLGGICDGEAYTLNGFNDSIPGDYIHNNVSIHGCDSIWRLHLVVSHSYDSTSIVHACDNIGYLYRDTIFTQSTLYTDSLLSVYSCDSVVHLDITIYPAFSNLHDYDLCDGDSIAFGDTMFYITTTEAQFATLNYIDSLHTLNGCDSLEVLSLRIHPVFDIFDTVFFCQNTYFNYRGQDYGMPQTIIDSLQSVWQCDSIMNITLCFYDTLFAAHPYFSIDSVEWIAGIKVGLPSDDTAVLAGCWPLRVFMSDSCSMDNQVPATNHTWHFTDDGTSISARFDLSHVFLDTGLFRIVHVVRSSDGCFDTAHVTVQVLPPPLPDFSFGPDLITTFEPTAVFVNLSGPDTAIMDYMWFFYPDHEEGNSLPLDSCDLRNPTFTWPDNIGDLTGEKDVMLVAYRHQVSILGDSLVCTDTVTKVVNIVNILLRFPNTVTPNGDGVNDVWNIRNIEYQIYPTNRLRIYDRWGKLVFKQENIRDDSHPWNPNDCDCPDGTYFYRFDAIGQPGNIQRSGAIEVIGSSRVGSKNDR